MRMRNEIKIQIPEGSRLIGSRKKGRTVIVSFEYNKEDAAVPEPDRYDQLVLPITRNPPGKIKNKVMQFNSKEYDPEKHDRWRALTVKQPYANDLVTAAYKDENGVVYGRKSIEVRSKKTSYRGDVLICSSAKPVYPGMESGVTLGLVELYDVKPIKDFTPEDWENTRIPKEKREKITKGFGWLMRNPRRVVEMPIKGQLGIYNLVYTKGEIIQYPRKMVIDKKSWEQIKKQIEK